MRANLLTPLDTLTVREASQHHLPLLLLFYHSVGASRHYVLFSQDGNTTDRKSSLSNTSFKVNVLKTLVIHDSSMCITYMLNSFISK